MRYIGMKWKQLSSRQKDNLISTATAIDAVHGWEADKTMDCLVDFEDGTTAVGHIEVTNETEILSVFDDSIIYDPRERVLSSKTDWGERFEAVRDNINATQKYVSEQIGIPLSTIKGWSSNGRETPEWVQDLVVEKMYKMKKEKK